MYWCHTSDDVSVIFTGGRRADHRGFAQCFLGCTATNQTADAGWEGGRQATPLTDISEHRNGHQHTQVRHYVTLTYNVEADTYKIVLHIHLIQEEFFLNNVCFDIMNYFIIYIICIISTGVLGLMFWVMYNLKSTTSVNCHKNFIH